MRTNNTIHWGLRIPGLGTATGSQWKLASWICISSPLLVICVTLNYPLVLVNVVSFMIQKERTRTLSYVIRCVGEVPTVSM